MRRARAIPTAGPRPAVSSRQAARRPSFSCAPTRVRSGAVDLLIPGTAGEYALLTPHPFAFRPGGAKSRRSCSGAARSSGRTSVSLGSKNSRQIHEASPRRDGVTTPLERTKQTLRRAVWSRVRLWRGTAIARSVSAGEGSICGKRAMVSDCSPAMADGYIGSWEPVVYNFWRPSLPFRGRQPTAIRTRPSIGCWTPLLRSSHSDHDSDTRSSWGSRES